MANAKELREQATQTIAEARSKLDAIGDKSSAEERKEAEQSVDSALKAASESEARADQIEALEAAEKRQEERMEAEERDARQNRRPPQLPASGDDSKTSYRTAFAKFVTGRSDDLTTEEKNVLRSRAAGTETRAQVAGVNTAGGYMVPTELMQEIDMAMAASGPMYSTDICRVLNTPSGNTMSLPTIDDTAQTDEKHTEAGAVTDDGSKDVSLQRPSLGAFAFNTGWVKWSWELESDSDFSWEGILGELLGERMGRGANRRLTVGSGNGESMGLVTASDPGKVTAGTSSVTADEILEFVHSIDPAYRASAKARVMFNDSTLLALRKLKDGDGNYLLSAAPDGSGRLIIGSVSIPYSINQAMAPIGTGNKFMVYGDFGKYFVRKVKDPTLFVAREMFAPDIGVLGLIRYDGALTNAKAIKHMKNA